jgi:RNA polymerase sigma-70 factor (ECF subfamily)
MRPMLVRCAYQVLRNGGEAEDVVQDAALIAWRRLETLREADHFGTWLYRVTFRAALDRLRRRRRRPECALTAEVGRVEASLETVTRARLLAERVHRNIANLPVLYREPIALWSLPEAFTYAEIGERLGISASVAKLRVFRAKRMIGLDQEIEHEIKT